MDVHIAAEKDQPKNALLVILLLANIVSANASLLFCVQLPGTPAAAEVLCSEAGEECLAFLLRGEH